MFTLLLLMASLRVKEIAKIWFNATDMKDEDIREGFPYMKQQLFIILD